MKYFFSYNAISTKPIKLTLSLFLLLTILLKIPVLAQQIPGDIFREYSWSTPEEEPFAKFLRVGGKLDYNNYPEKLPENSLKEGFIAFSGIIDLTNAVKAELTIEKMLCHEDTRDLRISWNQHDFIAIPEADSIPEPQSAYMHHYYPTIELPLDYIKTSENQFRLEVNPEQTWNWPQHLIYGIVLRVYYNKDVSPMQGELIIPEKRIIENTAITFKPNDSNQVAKVMFLGKYDGINYEGDGIYNQWHYHYHRGKIMNNIATTSQKPFAVNWNTSWIPDQQSPFSVSAWIVDKSGLTYFHPPISGLTFSRDYNVKLYKPYEQPVKWVTRSGEFGEKINIQDSLSLASKAAFTWVSWSPAYMNGLYVNDFLVFVKEGPKYAYKTMWVETEDMHIFEQGENSIRTGKTPLHHNQMVHGMEVQWPGIMVLIRYDPLKEVN
ncbi:MAG: hypothetical protein AAGI07_12405 [Bacteroidota bacterium]